MSKRSYKPFTKEDKEFLETNYLVLSDRKLGELLNRSEDNIRKHRQLLGLSRRGLNAKEVLAEVPIIIWLPRDAFGNYKIDFEKLKLGEK